MSRRKRTIDKADAPDESDAPQVAVTIAPTLDIRADGIYRPEQVRAALGLGSSALRAEWRAGRLRIVRRCKRNYIIGRDLIAWLDAGELPSPANRRQHDHTAAAG